MLTAMSQGKREPYDSRKKLSNKGLLNVLHSIPSERALSETREREHDHIQKHNICPFPFRRYTTFLHLEITAQTFFYFRTNNKMRR